MCASFGKCKHFDVCCRKDDIADGAMAPEEGYFLNLLVYFRNVCIYIRTYVHTAYAQCVALYFSIK
jgi:hypothetical protein